MSGPVTWTHTGAVALILIATGALALIVRATAYGSLGSWHGGLMGAGILVVVVVGLRLMGWLS